MDAHHPGLSEEYSFLIPDFVMPHFADQSILTIRIRYSYRAGISDSEYVDFNKIATDVRGFLSEPSYQNVYWEVINKKLVAMILQRYPALTSVTSELTMRPTQADPYVNSSIVTSRR